MFAKTRNGKIAQLFSLYTLAHKADDYPAMCALWDSMEAVDEDRATAMLDAWQETLPAAARAPGAAHAA